MTSFMKVSQLVQKLNWEPHKQQAQTHRNFLLWKKVAYISHWYMSLQIHLYVLYECINYEETHVISSMTCLT